MKRTTKELYRDEQVNEYGVKTINIVEEDETTYEDGTHFKSDFYWIKVTEQKDGSQYKCIQCHRRTLDGIKKHINF